MNTVNWIENPKDQIEAEYEREFVRYFGRVLSLEEFSNKLDEGKRVYISVDRDNGIRNMTRCNSITGVVDLIKTYRSYPQYRNEKTIAALYARIVNGMQVHMPLFVKKDGVVTIIAGNTRQNLAYIAGLDTIGQLIDLDE